MPDVIGMPWDLAKSLLNKAEIGKQMPDGIYFEQAKCYNVVITCPTKSFFLLKDNGYYVIRQRYLDDGELEVTLAARLLKEVSSNGLQDW